MGKVLAIVKREILSFFSTPRGYLLIAVYTAIIGFYYFNIVGRYNFLVSRSAGMQLDIQTQIPTLHQFVVERFYQMLVLSFVALIPIITMKSFASERRDRTFDLLRTSPLSTSQLVAAKFLANIALLAIFTLVAGIFISSLAIYGNPDCGQIICGLLGVFLCGVLFTALSLLIGSRSEHQINCAVFSIAFLTVFALIHTPAAIASPNIALILNSASPIVHLGPFTDGYVTFAGLAYYLGLTLLALVLTCVILDNERNTDSDKSIITFFGSQRTRFLSLAGIIASACVALLLTQEDLSSPIIYIHIAAIIIIFTIFFFTIIKNPSYSLALVKVGQYAGASLIIVLAVIILARSSSGWDFSSNRTNTLSQLTKATLAQLSSHLEITYFEKRDYDFDRRMLAKLELVKATIPNKVTIKTVDPLTSPSTATALGAKKGDLVALQLQNDQHKILRLRNIDEDSIRQALLVLNDKHVSKVYFLNGSGCARADDNSPLGLSVLVDSLRADNLNVSSLNNYFDTIPNDAEILAIIGPREPISERATSLILDFVKAGGKIFITTDPLFYPNVQSILNALGIESHNTVIIDSDQLTFSNGEAGLQPIIHTFTDNPIVNSFARSGVVIMNNVTPINASNTGILNWTVSEFAFSSAGSLEDPRVLDILQGKVSLAEALSKRNQGSQQAVAASISSAEQKPIGIVLGDSDWILNSAINYYANKELALNSFQWLLDRKWSLVPRIKSQQSSTVAIAATDFQDLVAYTIISIEIISILGILWCNYRRQ